MKHVKFYSYIISCSVTPWHFHYSISFWPCSRFHVCKLRGRTVSPLAVTELFWSSSGWETACLYTYQCDRVLSSTTTTFRYCDNASNKKATVDLRPCACECLISIQKTLLSIGYMDMYDMPHTWFILTNTSNRLVYLFAFNLKEKGFWSSLFTIASSHCLKKPQHICLLKEIRR